MTHDPKHAARPGRPQRKPTQGLGLTSMIDVIFLLLIYFVVTASFTKDEGVLTAKLPEGVVSDTPAVPIDFPTELRIVLAQHPSGPPDAVQVRVDGLVLASFTELFEFIQGVQDSPERGRLGVYAAEDPVLIAPEPGVRWQHVVNAMNAAVRAGYTDVRFVPASG